MISKITVVHVWTKNMGRTKIPTSGYEEEYSVEEFRLTEDHQCTFNDHGDLVFMKDNRPYDLIPRAMLGRMTFEYED